MLNEANKDTWCVNAYLNLSVEPDGSVTPCCKNSKLRYRTDSGAKTIAEDSVIEFWNSKDRQRLIDRLESGEKEKTCASCWQEESVGKESKRQIDNKRWFQFVTDRNQLPITMYLAPSNLCNLKCRICHSDRSSLIAEEEKKIHWLNRMIVSFRTGQKTGKKSFDSSNPNFWEDITPLLHNVKSINFSGGESFYVKNNWKLINDLIAIGNTDKQSITYNTNGTIFPAEQVEKLNKFKNIEINISIDGVGKKFTYIRHPADFNLVKSNIEKFAKTGWHLNASIAVSMFNIWDFFETFEFCRSQGLKVYLIFVNDDRSAKFMPRGLKDVVIERLMSHSSQYSDWESYRDQVIAFLNKNKSSKLKWKIFWMECKKRDEFRKEKFEEVFPEYYQEIKNYL